MEHTEATIADAGSLTSSLPSMKGRRGAIVIGSNYRALGVVRSLGRQGIPVWVLKETDEYLAVASKYAQRAFNRPATDERGQIAFLLDLASKHDARGWLVFPTEDESASLIARHHEELSKHFIMTSPPWDVLRWGYDKRLTYPLAKEVGVDCPWTTYPTCREDVAALECSFPVILKPAYKKSINSLTASKAWRFDDHNSLLAGYDRACGIVEPESLMIQEFIPASGASQMSFAALVKDEKPLAWLVARRTRQIPMDFGRFSTYVETLDEPEIISPSLRLLARMHFTGLVEFEYIYDPRDGRYKLLDINPRIWGWHTLGALAGMDFPYLLWRVSLGESVDEVPSRPGLRWVRRTADVPVALREVLRGRMSVKSLFKSFQGPIEHAVFAADDPLPGLAELPLVFYKLTRRSLRG